MFRRTRTETTSSDSTTTTKVGGKGRPTPTRKEAEAAAKARAKSAAGGKQSAAAQRSARAESSRTVRQAMKDGDERYYPARDRGPVRRFVRDYVDSRFSLIELVIPLLLVTLVLGYSGNPTLRYWGNTLLMFMVLFVVIDMVWLRFRLRREVARRFPDATTKGLTYYAVTRALQMKFMRMPKSQVKIGQQLPEDYR